MKPRPVPVASRAGLAWPRLARPATLVLLLVALAADDLAARGRSISDPDVLESLSQRLEEALSKSATSARTARANRRGDLHITRTTPLPPPPPPPPPSPPPPVPPPPPPPPPLDRVIDEAIERAHQAALRAELSAPVVPRWSYEGDTGPAHWAELRSDFETCARGTRQSPVDLSTSLPVSTLALDVRYRPSRFEVLDDGRSLVANISGANRLLLGAASYRLTTLRLHRPGEHGLAGLRPDLSAHLIHEGKDGRMVIVAVSLVRRDAGNPGLQSVLDALPLEPGGRVSADARIDPAQLLPPPGFQGRYEYEGSMSTPPCTEGVRWLVMSSPLAVSQAQIDTLKAMFPENARPTQPLNGRRIKQAPD